MVKVHRLTDHGKETLCGHEVALRLSDTGAIIDIWFKKSRQSLKVNFEQTTHKDECNTCWHIWKRTNA